MGNIKSFCRTCKSFRINFTFAAALGVLPLLVVGAPGTADAEDDDEEEEGGGGADHDPDHHRHVLDLLHLDPRGLVSAGGAAVLVVLRPAAEHVPPLPAAGAGTVEARVPLAHIVNVAGTILGSKNC